MVVRGKIVNRLIKKQKSLLKLIAQNHGCEHDPQSILSLINNDIIRYIKDQSFFLSEEVTEIMLAIGEEDSAILKPWSVRHNAIINKGFISTDKVRSEAIDMLCFCMNICIAIGLDEYNINEEYSKVFQKNMNRQENEY
jgi:NTP pyrophosphatase (non-canonical NTP hydrolase)